MPEKTKPPVVILAAGANTRMFPLNSSEHKGMIELCGESIISRTLRNLVDHNYTEIVIIVSPKDSGGNGLSGQLSSLKLPLSISFVTQPEATGMGEALLQAQSLLPASFFVIAPYHVKAGAFLDQLLAQGKTNIVCTVATATPWLFGIVTLEEGKVIGLTEKPPKGTEASDQKVQALYYFDQEYFDCLKKTPSEMYSFETALDSLMKQGKVSSLQLDEALPSIKFSWHLFDFMSLFLKSMNSSRASTATVAPTAIIDDSKGAVIIDDNAQIGDFVKIVGPTYIGKNVQVGDYSFVRASSLEMDVTVGAKTEVVRSILLSKSSIHFGYLADSIVGKRVKIGAGCITANKRLDRAEITVNSNGKKIKTGRTALGAIIGERANIGVSTSIMPGVCIGSESVIFPGSVLYHSLPAGSTYPKNNTENKE